MKYSTLEERIIREAWSRGDSIDEISARLLAEAGTRREYLAIVAKTSRMGLPCRNRPVPKALWVEVATKFAEKHGVELGCLMGDDKRAKTTRARWQAWKAIYGDGKRYSLSAIGRCVGVDHSSIHYARKMNFENDMLCGQHRRGKHPNSLAALEPYKFTSETAGVR